jgi:hypothetical protein
MTLGAVPGFVISASNYPLGAKIWVLQKKYPRDFARIDEANCEEALTSVASSQEPVGPRIVPKRVEKVGSYYLSNGLKCSHCYDLKGKEKLTACVQRGE